MQCLGSRTALRLGVALVTASVIGAAVALWLFISICNRIGERITETVAKPMTAMIESIAKLLVTIVCFSRTILLVVVAIVHLAIAIVGTNTSFAIAPFARAAEFAAQIAVDLEMWFH